MDVSLWFKRLIFPILLLFVHASCGSNSDIHTPRGRQAMIDDANISLSRGLCDQAIANISPLYTSPYVNETVVLVMASAYACKGRFNALTMIGNVSGSSSFFNALAMSLGNTAGDGSTSYLYQAVDVLTASNTLLSASQRTKNVNTYMTILQMAVMGSIFRQYGAPTSTGAKTVALTYNVGSGVGQLTNLDACGLTAAVSIGYDSYQNSNFTDANMASSMASINTLCTSAGYPGCTGIPNNRAACVGNVPNETVAQGVVAGINGAW